MHWCLAMSATLLNTLQQAGADLIQIQYEAQITSQPYEL